MAPGDPSSLINLSALQNRLDEAIDELSQRRRSVIVIALVVLLLVGWFALSHRKPHADIEATFPRASDISTTTQIQLAVVHVAGAVVKPGVYKVPLTARVQEVVVAAGGLTENADIDRTNLASKVSDGQRIFIAVKGQAVPPEVNIGSGDVQNNEPLDLNTATAAQLEDLPGIGPATAKAILDYRTKNGSFKSVQDLQKIKGIGQSKFAQISSLVRV